MERIRERAKRQFPSVLLTLLSIMQALAIEVLWSGLREHEHLWTGGLPAAISWLQVTAVVLGIMVVWLFYTSLVMRIVWVPSTRDSIMPFVIGISEFVLAQTLAPEYLHWWLCLLGGLFAVSTWTSTSTLEKARDDPDNAALFEQTAQGSPLAQQAPYIFVGMLVFLGVAVKIWGAGGLLALASVILANLALVIQLLVIRGFWHRSVREDEPDEAGD